MSPQPSASTLVAALEEKLAQRAQLEDALLRIDAEITQTGALLRKQHPRIVGALNGVTGSKPRPQPGVLSQREFGKKWGTSEKPVRYAISRGLIHGAAITDNRQVVVQLAEAQLAELDPKRSNTLALNIQSARRATAPDPEKPAKVGDLPEGEHEAPMAPRPIPEPVPDDRPVPTESEPEPSPSPPPTPPSRTVLEAALDEIAVAGISVESLGGDQFLLNGHMVGVEKILSRAEKLRERRTQPLPPVLVQAMATQQG